MKKYIVIALLLVGFKAEAATITVTNVVTITANTNVQATLKAWLDANEPAQAGSNYVARFQARAGLELTNWIKRVYREQDQLNQYSAADAIIQSNKLVSPVGP